MSMTPITPGQLNADPAPADIGDLEAAFQRVLDTPGDAPVHDLESGEIVTAPVEPASSTREEGDGGGDVSPVPAPNATPDAPTSEVPEGGAVDATPPAPVEGQTDGFQIVEGDGDLPPAATTPVVELTAPAAPDGLDVNSMMESYLGRKMTAAEGRELLTLIEDLSSGRVVLTPAQQAALAQQPQPLPAQAQQPTAVPQQPPAPAPTYFDEWGNPVQVPATPSLPPEVQAQLDEMAQWRQQQEAVQQQQYAQWVAQEQGAGAEEFASAPPIPLSQEELLVLEQKAGRSGIFALEMQRTNNPRLAWRSALEQTMYTDPAFRERIIEAQVAARSTADVEVQNRQRLAASVSAGGGTVPGTQPIPPSGPPTMADAKEGATRDLQSLFANGQPGG